MWSLSLFAALASPVAHARPLGTVVVRPLPPAATLAVGGAPTREQIIAASYVDYTVTHTTLGRIDAADGVLVPFPSAFTCIVTGQVLAVSYTREGIDTDALPRFGTCGLGDDAVRFRIKVKRAPGGA